MNTPPIPLDELRERLLTAMDVLDVGDPAATAILAELGGKVPHWIKAHLELEHSVPSASAITDCALKLYWKNAKRPMDRDVPRSWKREAMMGILQEPYWIAALQLAGVNVTLAPDTGYQLGEHMVAHPDGMLDALNGLVEIKLQNGYVYKRLLEGHGVAFEKPENYAQIQLYLHATGRRWGLYLTSPNGAGVIQTQMRQNKRYGSEYQLPEFYLEWVEYDPNHVAYLLKRADLLAEFMTKDEPPAREFDGRTRWPCSYCVYQFSCNNEIMDQSYYEGETKLTVVE